MNVSNNLSYTNSSNTKKSNSTAYDSLEKTEIGVLAPTMWGN